jgi:site-specific DNA-adenine methylase
MKNHFFFSWVGNKRQEVEHIYDNINLDGINTIIEPFCGSCAVSYYIWTQNKDQNFKYILNDLDNDLIEFLKACRNNKLKEIEDDLNIMRADILKYENDMITAKIKYLEYINQNKISSWVLKRKCYSMIAGIFPIRDFKRHFNDKQIDLLKIPILDFLTNADIEIYNEDANKIIDRYDKEKSFIFLDPPYIASCNNFYSTDTNENTSNIYEKLYLKGLKNFNSKIMICHENNWLFKILFREYLDGETEYEKKYQTRNKKETTHICVKNFLL